MSRHQSRPHILVVPLVLMLAACGANQKDDLDRFIQDAGKDMRGKIDPLPEVKPYEPFVYNEDGALQDPFKPRKAVSKIGSVQPNLDRPKEPGENYPLESLKYVGSLSRGKEIRALLKAPDNVMLEVRVGEHVGQNFGLVTSITEAEIKIKEIVQDELTGEWTERPASITLQE